MINSIFFAPCAWYMTYHLGAWRALKEFGYVSNIKSLGGGSSGSLVAVLLSSNIDEEIIKKKFDYFALTYATFLCWGKMTKIVGRAIDENLTDNIDLKFSTYVVITNFQYDLPPIGPRFITINKDFNKNKVKDLILSSCYIPVIYEKIPKWDNKFVLDGGMFLMNLNIPNTLTISPYMQMSENVIGYELNSNEEKILKKNKFISLYPDKEILNEIYNVGYISAKKWLNYYGK